MAEGDRLAVIGALVRRESVSDQCTHGANEHKLRVGDDHPLIPLFLTNYAYAQDRFGLSVGGTHAYER